MDCLNSIETNTESPYELLLRAVLLIPISRWLLAILFFIIVSVYNFLEIHLLRDLFAGFRGQLVDLVFDSSSDVYRDVVSQCKILRGRYLSTPWLCSPHLQTAFLSFFGWPPAFSYRRQIFQTSDGGTIALDWLLNMDVKKPFIQLKDAIHSDCRDPIMIVIPGLTSDSGSAYIKHLAFETAKLGWNVVVSNHRGLGGVSITSDCFYNAGWTEDIRKIVHHIHNQHPEAPLFLVGTSIGANVLVKYLGEDGANIPILGASAICSPWDLLICDRFINRRLVQRFYDKVLAIGLKGYAQLHKTILSRLVDWEGIEKSRSVRDFDNYATRVLGKYETVDTYYRRCSSASFVGNVMIPLLCISALDDPVCTHEAIPWDECRFNKNVVLATTQHGGHLAFYEGLTAKNIWNVSVLMWVRAVNEFFSVLLSSPLIHKKKELQVSSLSTPQESSMDQAPFVNVQEDRTVAAIRAPITNVVGISNEPIVENDDAKDMIPSAEVNDQATQEHTNVPKDQIQQTEQEINSIISPVKRRVDQLVRRSSKSMWLLVYVAIITTWPVVGSALVLLFKNKIRNVHLGKFAKR